MAKTLNEAVVTMQKRNLSPARQKLIELMQEINFGRIEHLVVRHGEPVVTPPPRMVREVVFGKVNAANDGRSLTDFVLKEQLVELFALFDHEQSFSIESLVVQNGLPIRMTVAKAA